jgi:hypothetical protein
VTERGSGLTACGDSGGVQDEASAEPPIVTASEVVKIGRERRAELEVAARREQRDATNLARLLIRDGLAARARERREVVTQPR